MRKLEKVLAVLIILSLVMRLLHLPGSATLLIASTSLLALIYYFLSFAFFNNLKINEIFKRSSYKDISVFKIIGVVGLGWGLATLLMGIMFKLMFWPGAEFNLLMGLVIVSLLIVVFVNKFLISKSEFYIPLFKRVAIIAGVALFLVVLPQMDYIRFMYRKNPAVIEAYENYFSDPANENFQKQLHYILNRGQLTPNQLSPKLDQEVSVD